MNLDKLKVIAIIAVCVVAILVLTETAYTIHVLRPKAIETVSNLNDTTGDVKEYVHEQLAVVRSPAFQKNIEHSSEVGDITAKTIAQIARRTLPRVDRAVDELTARLVGLDPFESEMTRATARAADLMAHTDASLNVELLPAITKIVNKSGATLDEVNAAFRIAAEGLDLTTEELKRRLADKRVDAMMDEALGILREGHGVMMKVHEASNSAPGIATSLEKIASESSRFARVTLIANILGTLGRAFLP